MTTALFRRWLPFALSWAVWPGVAHADYARPPYGYDEPDRAEPPRISYRDERRSTVRFFTGPLLRVTDSAARAGLGAAVDVGARAAGLRLSGAWSRAGGGGVAQYGAETWLDFADGDDLHPILAAGAAVARLDAIDAEDHVTTRTLGVATLRAALQYALPLRGVDARASLDLVGNAPAIGASSAHVSPWATVSLSVGVGF